MQAIYKFFYKQKIDNVSVSQTYTLSIPKIQTTIACSVLLLYQK